MRKIFFKLTRDMFPLVKDRYPFVYLEHGRLEVDDSSVKWIGSDATVIQIPVATIAMILLGPGTSITHAAVAAVAAANCSVAWVGEESLHFYAYGMPPSADTQKLMMQVRLASQEDTRVTVSRRFFAVRFPGVDLEEKSLPVLMGMEGVRVRALYGQLSEKYGVEWHGRSYVPGKAKDSSPVNFALTFLNSLLYGLLTSCILASGYSPRIGFIHSGSPLPLVYDVADLYKAELTIDLAFALVAQGSNVYDRKVLIEAFCERVVNHGMLKNAVGTIDDLILGKQR